jgi:L-lysine 2,3-aminomutase
MRASVSSAAQLVAQLHLPQALAAPARAAAAGFGVRVPQSFVARMRTGDVSDPLLRQVLPLAAELAAVPPGYGPDPLAESDATRASGLLQKYHGRALLITTAACAIHCRYCFRREFPYAQHQPDRRRFAAALAAIAADPSLAEIILSGGDPLSLANARLDELLQALGAIPHVRRLRIHTRTPVVLQARVDAGLGALLQRVRVPLTVVLHANHARELDTQVADACARLRASGALLLNQSVLLRGVNDDAAVLAELSERLHECGVQPYYLHLPDRVRGTQHFAVSERRARGLAAQLGARLPGYLVPRLARELPSAPGKVLLAPTRRVARARMPSQCDSAATIASTPSTSCSSAAPECSAPVL